jgi:RNA polymerase sigma-70 factor (ECF subfamily)
MAVDVASAEQPGEVTANEPEESALQELAACMKPLMGKLALADREALRLIEVEGLTQVEAARRLGLSLSGMKSRVQRARLRLRSALDDCCLVALDRRGGVLGYEGRGGQCDPADCAPVPTPSRMTE